MWTQYQFISQIWISSKRLIVFKTTNNKGTFTPEVNMLNKKSDN